MRMDKLRTTLLVGTFLVSSRGTPSLAQDGSELGRPKAVVEYDLHPGEEPRKAMERMVVAAKRAGFEPREPIQWSDGFFTAVRTDSKKTVEDRAVIWLDWRYSAPQRTLGVYVDYARFKKPVGSGWERQSTSLQERSDALQPLVQSILHAAAFPGL